MESAGGYVLERGQDSASWDPAASNIRSQSSECFKFLVVLELLKGMQYRVIYDGAKKASCMCQDKGLFIICWKGVLVI